MKKLCCTSPQVVDKLMLNPINFDVNELQMQIPEENSHTFPPEKRLRCREDFTLVFSKAEHRFRQDKLHLIAKSQKLSHSRVGLVIPKKMLKKAVHRNRLKRIIRDEFRRWHFCHPCDMIISLKQKIDPAELYQQDIHQVIQKMLSRLERYANRQPPSIKQ